MNENSPAGIAFLVYVIVLVLCSMEIVPGWGMFNLDWNPSTFYWIAIVTGIVCGIFIAREDRIAGMIAVPVGGVGALLATSLVLKHSTETSNGALALAGCIGALPGLLVFSLVRKITNSMGVARDTNPPSV